MTALLSLGRMDVENRARRSQGTSAAAIYRMVAQALEARQVTGELVLDVGCGTGNLWAYLRERFRRYVGLDALCYEGFPADAEFMPIDLDAARIDLSDGSADAVTALETIEHLENPRALIRELVRLAKPGGWVIVTTPTQLRLLSKMTLLLKNQFNAFQASSYPAHLTALLEVDLRRLALENRLGDVEILYSRQGRLAFTAVHYPEFLSKLFPRACSDNVLLIGRKPDG